MAALGVVAGGAAAATGVYAFDQHQHHRLSRHPADSEGLMAAIGVSGAFVGMLSTVNAVITLSDGMAGVSGKSALMGGLILGSSVTAGVMGLNFADRDRYFADWPKDATWSDIVREHGSDYD